MSLLDKVKRWAGIEAQPPEEVGDLRGRDAEAVAAALRVVMDPELGLDIVSMGLIRAITIEDERVHVRMTLTTAGCPVGPWIVDEVKRVLAEGGLVPEVELQHEPPWSPDDMSPEARAELRWMGR